MDEDRLQKLEMKISYLEETVDELNAVVTDSRKEMTRLEEKIAVLARKVQDLMDSEGEDIPSRRPPHY